MRCRTSSPRRPRWRFQRVGGIGHELQLAQHKLRNDDRAVEKLRLGDVRHAAIDDDARVEHLHGMPIAAFAAEKAAERLQVEHVAFVRTEHQADIGHHQKHREAEERPRALRHRRVRKDERHQVRAQNSEDRTDRRADQPAQAGPLQARLKKNDGDSKDETRDRSRVVADAEGAEMVSNDDANSGEDQPQRENIPKRARANFMWAGGNDRLGRWRFGTAAACRSPAGSARRPGHVCTL